MPGTKRTITNTAPNTAFHPRTNPYCLIELNANLNADTMLPQATFLLAKNMLCAEFSTTKSTSKYGTTNTKNPATSYGCLRAAKMYANESIIRKKMPVSMTFNP